MKSNSSFSCFGTLLVACVGLVLLRFALPEVFIVLVDILTGTLYIGAFLALIVLGVIGYFTYRNLKRNEQKEEEKKFGRVSQTEQLYGQIVEKLQGDMTLNQVTAEEFLQSEILITEKLQAIKKDLIRLKDFTSPANEKWLSQQLRDYGQQLQQTSDSAAREVIEENLKILEEKKQRMSSALEEIRQKEGSVDLVYNSLLNVEESIKFGRAVERLFPPDLYRRFELSPPAEQPQLPPLTEKSSTNE